jgi:hypothetical protein
MKLTVVVLFLLLAQAIAPVGTAAQRGTPRSHGSLLVAPERAAPRYGLAEPHPVLPSLQLSAMIEPDEEGPDPVMASGLFLGVIGMLGGAALGGARESACDKECRAHSGAIGAIAGGALMIPIGAHIGNRGRGNLLLSMLAASAVGAAGFGAASLLPGRPVAAAVFFTAPIQVVLAAKIEHWTEPAPPITTK